MDVYLEEIVLFNERIINMITKSMGDIVVLYPIIRLPFFFLKPWKQIKNHAEYETFLPKPLTLTFFFFDDVRYVLWRWKG